MHRVFWQHKTNQPDGRHRAGGVDCRETSTPSGRRCTTQQVRPYGRGAIGSGCHPLHPNRGRCPPWLQSHRSLGATTRAAVCLPRYAHDPTPSVKFARVQSLITPSQPPALYIMQQNSHWHTVLRPHRKPQERRNGVAPYRTTPTFLAHAPTWRHSTPPVPVAPTATPHTARVP